MRRAYRTRRYSRLCRNTVALLYQPYVGKKTVFQLPIVSRRRSYQGLLVGTGIGHIGNFPGSHLRLFVPSLPQQ